MSPLDRQRITLSLIPRIARIARRLHRRLPTSVELDDLVQTGAEALVTVLAHVEHPPATPYLDRRVRGAMIDELRRMDPLTRRDRMTGKRVDAAAHSLEVSLGRAPTDDEVAAVAGLDLERIQRMHARRAERPLDAEGPAGDDPEALAVAAEGRARLVSMVADLPAPQQVVIRLRYAEDLSLREIGASLGLSESRACQLHGEAVTRLRAAA